MENEYGLLEVEVDENGEIDDKYEDLIIQKCKEAEEEGIWYTQEEIVEMLDRLEKENLRWLESYIHKEQE